jgi:hypothetical protein
MVTVYSKPERENLHRQGYWIDRQGNILAVKDMSYERLGKLVKLLAEWATKEDKPIEYLARQPIVNHVYNRIVHFGMKNFHTEMFKSAVASKMASKSEVKVEEEMYCLTHGCWGIPRSLSKDCLWVSCPPPEMEPDWELSL